MKTIIKSTIEASPYIRETSENIKQLTVLWLQKLRNNALTQYIDPTGNSSVGSILKENTNHFQTSTGHCIMAQAPPSKNFLKK